MNDSTLEALFYVPRANGDRRSANSAAPPYFTEEGIVMLDRRENGERRKASQAGDAQSKRKTARAL